MFRKILTTLVALLVSVALSACSLGGNSSSASKETRESLSKSSNQEMVVGLWEFVNDEGVYKSYEFSDEGKVVVDNSYLLSYEFASDTAIALRGPGEQDLFKLLKVVDVTKNKLVLEDDIWQETYTRTKPIANLASEMIGYWEADNQRMFEFTPDGKYLDNYVLYSAVDEGDFPYYEILGNTIAVYRDQQEYDLYFVFRIVDITNDTLVIDFDPSTEDNKATLKKKKNYPSLAKDLIGTWSNIDGETVWEFTEDGTVINYLANSIDTYTVVSENTFSIIEADPLDVFHFVVLDFTGETMKLNFWFPPEILPQDAADALVFTKVK